MQHLAALSGISIVTLYKYFDNKQALINASIQVESDAQYQEQAKLIQDMTIDFPSKLTHIFLLKNQHDKNIHPEFKEAIFKYITSTPEFKSMLYQQSDDLFHSFINQGRNEGYISTAISNDTLSFVMAVFMEYISNHPDPQHWQNTTMGDELNALLYFGLLGSSDKLNSDQLTAFKKNFIPLS